MAINHGSLSANLTPRGVVGGRVQNSVLAYENDYENLINKPSINGTELNGDLSLEDLGIVNNVQPDWGQTDTEADDYINNKPDIPENLSDLNDDADHRTVSDTEKTTWNNKSDFSGSYNDLTNKPVIPDAQIQSDWNQNDNTKADYIKNKPSIPSAQVQSDWNESDSSKADFIKNKPTIPAEQVNSDWDAESGKAQILNKPSIPTALADLTDDSTHRTVTDTEKTAWNSGEANVQSNWNETDTTSDAYIQNKPSIPSVTANPGSTTATLSSIEIDGTNYAISGGSGGGAVNSVNGKTGDVILGASDVGALPDDTPLFSGDYEDLTNKPTIPTVNNSTITIQKNGQNVDSFTLNQNTNKAIDISVPTKTSDITNDSSFITNTVNNLANYYLKSETYTKTEVSNLIDAAVNGRFEKVQTLPVTGEANVIYLVPKTTALTNNVYDEYIWQDNAWELLGSTEIDLSGYVTDEDLATALQSYLTTSAFATAIANYYTKTEVGTLLDNKVDKVNGKGLSTYDYDATAKAIVDSVTANLATKVDKVAGKGLSTNDYDNTAKGIVDGVTSALATKVDKVDGKGLSTNDYTTEEKTKLTGISEGANKVESSETNGNIVVDGTEVTVYNDTDIQNAIEDIDDIITTDESTIEGNPINFSTLSAQNAKSTILSVEPIQDLHGFDKPWVGGASINLFDCTISGGSYIKNGVTYTNVSDSDGNVLGVKAINTATDYAFLDIPVSLSAGRYKTNVIQTNDTVILMVRDSSLGWLANANAEFTLNEATTVYIRYAVVKGVNANCIVNCMLYEYSGTDKSFVPYSNLCPISGRTEIGILGEGKNLCSGIENGTWDTANQSKSASNNRARSTKLIKVESSTQYCISAKSSDSKTIQTIAQFYSDIGEDTFISETSGWENVSRLFITPENCKYITIIFRTSNNDINPENYMSEVQLEKSNQATEHEPYTKSNDLTISLGQTVYGGTLDVENGVLVVTDVVKDLGDLTWSPQLNDTAGKFRMVGSGIESLIKKPSASTVSADIISSCYETKTASEVYHCNTGISINTDGTVNIYDENYNTSASASAFDTFITGQTLCYKLATPIEIQLTPNQISLLEGVNNISVDDNFTSISLTYRDGSVATLNDVKVASENLKQQIADSQILTDTVTGDKYRLVVTNGVLSVEQISN